MLMFMLLSSWHSTATVHPVRLTNAAQCRAAVDIWTKPIRSAWATDPHKLAAIVPDTRFTIAIYYYYSARKLKIILASHGG